MPWGIKKKYRRSPLILYLRQQTGLRSPEHRNKLRTDKQFSDDSRQLLSLDLIISTQNRIHGHSPNHLVASAGLYRCLSQSGEKNVYLLIWSTISRVRTNVYLLSVYTVSSRLSLRQLWFTLNTVIVWHSSAVCRLPAETCAQDKYLNLHPKS